MMTTLLSSEEQYMWESLADVTRLGCRSDGESLIMPWVWGEDLGFDDPFSTFLAAGPDVAFRDAASDEAAVFRSLDWEAVKLLGDWSNEERYARVRAVDGTEGYVLWEQLRSEIDYRLIARRIDGDWKIVTFVAGD